MAFSATGMVPASLGLTNLLYNHSPDQGNNLLCATDSCYLKLGFSTNLPTIPSYGQAKLAQAASETAVSVTLQLGLSTCLQEAPL